MDSNETPVTIELTARALQEIVTDPTKISYVVLLDRLGAYECIVRLEYTHYQPKTDRNDLFGLVLVQWQGVHWAIITIPKEEAPLMQEVADQCGLRVANGVPTMIGGGGIARFPVDGDNIFTLENKPDHPVYQGNPEKIAALRARENATVEGILNR